MKTKVYNFTVLIEQDEDGWYVVKVPSLRGCVTQGKTIKQALARIKEVIELCLMDKKERPDLLKFVKVEHVAVRA
ncbi:type II toxin-antitoxin system HicB family antitoxin [Candidatus Woesearchaeota archaeon]|nr:type II toxin-antitoxin system HicB family antitoxin [Candidatus Woesearchaeota archaeon]